MGFALAWFYMSYSNYDPEIEEYYLLKYYLEYRFKLIKKEPFILNIYRYRTKYSTNHHMNPKFINFESKLP